MQQYCRPRNDYDVIVSDPNNAERSPTYRTRASSCREAVEDAIRLASAIDPDTKWVMWKTFKYSW